MPALAAYFQRRVGPDDAPDLLGETMVVAWRRVAELPADSEGARMWLFGIARGTLLNHARGERRRLALVDRLRSTMSLTRATNGADEGADVRDAIDRLDENLAEIVKLVHWDGFALPEVADILGVPLTAVRSRYRRARDTLRIALSVDSTINLSEMKT
ncbi:sigma-70 family RNA polymerase sigma factor [uncultured Microbacterium sp.]|uniref:RNA polymerase sigma factor n=1 Tax=uncultured Microbacterium sp. TaxID=191216 RepID=UPI00260B7A56|nr:sigma-70 family RNA polymerase sigma factor [uncultured Microbacterium sp.]